MLNKSMTYRVDTHVILIKDEWVPEQFEWFEECLESLANEPTNVHFIEGTFGHTGKYRAEGFAAGDAEYVAFVDPDDVVFNGAYQACIDYLDENPDVGVVCTQELTEWPGGRSVITPANIDMPNYRITRMIHHIAVARRSIMENYIDFIAQFPFRCERALWMEMYKDGVEMRFIEKVGYKWRKHKYGAHRIYADEATNKYLKDTWNILKERHYSGVDNS